MKPTFPPARWRAGLLLRLALVAWFFFVIGWYLRVQVQRLLLPMIQP